MMRGQTEIAAAIREAAEFIEADHNNGYYVSYFPDSCRWIFNYKYKTSRDGILFYSSGHGWRVRRRPAWQDIFKQRFPFWGREGNDANKKD